MSLVSVIIPTHNREAVVLRAINSVLNQTYKDFEIIIVDDGSIDNTEQALGQMTKSGQIKYLKIPNQGVSFARNLGVKESSGKLISFLDSDDEWLPHKLQEQIDFLAQNKNIQIVYGQEIWQRNGKRVNQKLIHQKHGGWIFNECVQQCFIAPSAIMLKKEIFLEMTGFDESFVVCEDYDLWLKISSLYEVGYISNPIMIKHGGHADQLSTKYIAMDIWRLRALLRILSIRNLTNDQQLIVKEAMRKKGSILQLGYQKHGNSNGFNEVEIILNKLSS